MQKETVGCLARVCAGREVGPKGLYEVAAAPLVVLDERLDEGPEGGEVLRAGEGIEQAFDVHRSGGFSRRGAAMLKKVGSVHATRR